jgi:hypothetical protein
MGLFNKKDKKQDIKSNRMNDIPRLPEIPQLPELPEFGEGEFEGIHQLPKFPNNSLGKKISQNSIKEAVTGKKREEVFADEFGPMQDNEFQMMQGPQTINSGFPMQNRSKEISSDFEAPRIKENEPIFVRIDKFEDGLNALDVAKKQIAEVEKTLRDIRKLKEDEERELSSWEKQVQTAKEQIEKIDKDIFSKIE